MPRYLADVNVWLALVHEGHEHHQAARKWFHALGAREAAFCRLSQLGVLRLLTTAQVMKDSVHSMNAAWSIVDALHQTGRVTFLEEPPLIESALRSLTAANRSSPKFWTDAYFAVFAKQAGVQLATFDQALAEHGATLLAT